MSGVESVDLAALMMEADEPYDWLVPGLLERGDRLILTGLEGRGKSTLLRQMAVQLASGIHPFTGDDIQPLRVLVVDLENSRRQVRRKVGDLHKAAGSSYRGGALFLFRPDGLDIGSTKDLEWLDQQILHTAPIDVVVVGPLYKLLNGDSTREEVALDAATALDELRVRHQCAVIIEAHSPYADGSKSRRPTRPYGASLWSRWPEFGIFLGPEGDLEHWRGARDEREWPSKLQRGAPWPWIVDDRRVDAGEWNGPQACMEAIESLLRDNAGTPYTTNNLLSTLRALGHTFRDKTVREAAERLSLEGRITVRSGPRNSRLFAVDREGGDSNDPF